jgi:hypothetical protein
MFPVLEISTHACKHSFVFYQLQSNVFTFFLKKRDIFNKSCWNLEVGTMDTVTQVFLTFFVKFVFIWCYLMESNILILSLFGVHKYSSTQIQHININIARIKSQ